VGLFDFVNGFVGLKLHPVEAFRVRIKEVHGFASIKTNVFRSSELKLLSKVDEDRTDVFGVNVGTFKF